MALVLAKGGQVDAKLKSAALQRNHTPGEPLLGAGTTPLMRAARNGDFRAMQLLVAAGADAALTQPNGTTVLMLASRRRTGPGRLRQGRGHRGRPAGGREDPARHGADVNAANTNGLTAMHYAAQAGLDSVVSELARHGARLDAKDKQGRTPVDVALGVGNRGRAGGPPPVFQGTAALIKRFMGETPARAVGPGPVTQP